MGNHSIHQTTVFDIQVSQYDVWNYQIYSSAAARFVRRDSKLQPGSPLLCGSTFKFGGSVSEASIDIRMAFVRKVYAILSVQLIATAVLSSVSFFSDSYKDWIQSNQWMMWLSLFGAIGFMILTYWKRKSYPTNLLFLSGFTAFEAYSVSVIVSFYQSRIVLQAVLLTAGIFVALTLIFSAYILVDTQLIMRHYHVEEEIAAAFSLYLDIINLFLNILRILNSQQNN